MFSLRKIVYVSGARWNSTWKVMGSALLERPAVIVRKFDALESAYMNLLSEQEVENSLLSDFELKQKEEEEEVISSDSKKKSKVRINLAVDMIREWKAEKVAALELLKQTTVSDVKSVRRCLDEPLVLIAKLKLGNDSCWLLPQTLHEKGESMRETAERALREAFGTKFDFITMGNAPCAFYKYKYPKEIQDETGFCGAKIFFHKMQYRSGEVQLNSELGEDFMWASRDERMEKFRRAFSKAVEPSIFVAPRIDFTPLVEKFLEPEEIEQFNMRKAN